jgi:hypothetical protein
MVAAFFQELTSIAESFVTFLVSLFQSVVSLFWTPATSGEGGSLTVIGTFMLIGIATGLVIWAFYFIKNMVRIKTQR